MNSSLSLNNQNILFNSNLSKEREDLKQKIEGFLLKNGALKDPVINAIKELESYIKTINYNLTFSGTYNLKDRIDYPEKIIQKNGPNALIKLINEIERTSKTVKNISPILLKLSEFYRSKLEESTKTPLPSMVQITGDLIEPYLITQELALKIISRNKFGDITKTQSTSNSRLHEGIAFKCGTSDIGMETSIYLLHSLLFGTEIDSGVAPTSFLNINAVQIDEIKDDSNLTKIEKSSFEKAKQRNQRNSFFSKHPHLKRYVLPVFNSFYVKVTQLPDGEPLNQSFDKEESFRFDIDNDNFSSLILSSFLTIPSNSDLKNFLISFVKIQNKVTAKLTSIKNDMTFANPIITRGEDHYISLKNSLYYFEQMMNKPISSKVRERFRQINPLLFAIKWAIEVDNLSKRYESLIKNGYLKESDQAMLPLRFTSTTLRSLIINLEIIQKILSNPDLKSITHQQLFRLLFPIVEKYYQSISQGTLTTAEKIEMLFSSQLPSIEQCVDQSEILEEGRTVRAALKSENKSEQAYQYERIHPINKLVEELLASTDLSLLSPEDRCLLVCLIADQFPQIASNKSLHSSWKSDNLLFLVVQYGLDLKALKFLKVLGYNFSIRNDQEDTITHLIAKNHEIYSNTQTSDLIKNLNLPFNLTNNKGLLPIEVAMEQRSVFLFVAFLKAGGGGQVNPTIAWEFYETIVKNSQDEELKESFDLLVDQNSLLQWRMAREFIFPKKCQDGRPTTSALFGQRMLHPDAVKQLWSVKDSKFEIKNIFGKRKVGKVTLNNFTIYFKQLPELPGIEQAVESLSHGIFNFGTPHSDLIKIDGVPFLISLGIKGISLQEILQSNPKLLSKLDRTRLSQIILLAMIVNPEDGKPDNYIVEPLPNQEGYRLVSIDNDHAFVPSVAEVKYFQDKKNLVQVKTVLFCLDQMHDPIDPGTKEQLLLVDPSEILTDWLRHLSFTHSLYNELFSSEEREKLFKIHGSYIGIPFRKESAISVYKKFAKIQSILDREKNNHSFTHFMLLQELNPVLAKRYQNGFQNPNITNPFEKFRLIDGSSYIQKRGTFVSTREAKEILISQKIITKKTMRHILKNSDAYDPSEALLSLQKLIKEDEDKTSKRFALSNSKFIDLKALNYSQISETLKQSDFKTIPIYYQRTILKQISKVNLSHIDLSHASLVTKKYLRKLNLKYVTFLNLSYCQQLTDQIMGNLLAAAPELKTLNLSGIYKIQQIRGTYNRSISDFEILNLNKITDLTLANCINLQSLCVSSDHLVNLDCSYSSLAKVTVISSSLESLNLKNNIKINNSTMDDLVSKCPKLKKLNLQGCCLVSKKQIRSESPHFPVNLIGTKSWIENTVLALLRNEVKVLNLNSCKEYSLSPLLEAAKFCTSLRELNIFNQNLLVSMKDQNAKKIVETFEENPFIEVLRINNLNILESNIVSIIAKIFSNKNQLRSLDLEGNSINNDGIKILSNEIKNNFLLECLKLSYNSINDEGVVFLAGVINSCSSLRVLNLAGNLISNSGILELAKALRNNLSLKELDLSQNRIDDQGLEALSGAISTNKSLRSLDLSENNFSHKGLKVLAMGLALNETITEIKLSGNNIKDNDLNELAITISSSDSLKKLDLSNNEIQIKGILELRKAISSSKLEEVDLSSNQIGGEGAFALMLPLKSKTSLKILKLSKNKIDDFGAKALKSFLSSNKSLEEIDLSDNEIGSEGILEITQVIQYNSSLKRLKLGGNKKFDNNCINSISNLLKSNCPLQALDISNSGIAPIEIINLLVSLHSNSHLRDLNLSKNKFETQSTLALTDLLKTNSHLKNLDLSRCKIKNDLVDILSEGLSQNRSLETLHLDKNYLEIPEINRIIQSINKIPSLHTLGLSDSRLEIGSLDDLADSLKNNTSLQTLDLSYNRNIAIDQHYLLNSGFIPSQIPAFRDIYSYEGTILQRMVIKTSSKLPYEDIALQRDESQAIESELLLNNSDKYQYRESPWRAKINNISFQLKEAFFTSSPQELALIFAISDNIDKFEFIKSIKKQWPNLSEEKFSSISEQASASIYLWSSKQNQSSLILELETSSYSSNKTIHLLKKTNGYVYLEPLVDESNLIGQSSQQLATPNSNFLKGQVLEYSDLREAIDFYLKAAIGQHEEALSRIKSLSEKSYHAEYALGQYNEHHQNIEEAISFYYKASAGMHIQSKQALEKLAESNDYAKYCLSMLYLLGHGVKDNLKHAIELLKVSAENGLPLSKLQLGILYYQQLSSEEDNKKALELVEEAEAQGLAEATHVKSLIIQKQREIEELIERAKSLDKALYLLSAQNNNQSFDISSALPKRNNIDIAAITISKRNQALKASYSQEKSILEEQLSSIEHNLKISSGSEKKILEMQRSELLAKTSQLEKEYLDNITTPTIQHAQMVLLNEKRSLFYDSFKKKISDTLEVVNALLSGKVTRDVSMAEEKAIETISKVASSATKWGIKEAAKFVPIIGSTLVFISEKTFEKLIDKYRTKKLEDQCKKIQTFYSNPGALGAENLSSQLAAGITYRYQDQLIHLDGESIERLSQHLSLRFQNYLFDKAPEGSTVMELIIGGSIHKFTSLEESFLRKPLKTDSGLKWEIDDFLLSTGIQTPYGGKYLPRDPKRRKFIISLESNSNPDKEYKKFRMGTKEEIKILTDNKIEMECLEHDRIGVLTTSVDKDKSAARFMLEAQLQAEQYVVAPAKG